MIRIALSMLTSDTAKYVGLVCGVAIAVMLMARRASIFVGLMLRTAAQVIDVVDADLSVMDQRVIHAEEIEPFPQSALWRVRGVAKDLPSGEGTIRVLHGIDLSVRSGGMLLIGPSDCGKTTPISILAGILSATEGRSR